MRSLNYSPFDPVVIDDPYPTYRALREEAPLYWSRNDNAWVLSRYHDVYRALMDVETYSSASGVFPAPPGVDVAGAFLPMLLMSDPPKHTRLRKHVSRAFTPRRIAELESHVADLAADLLERLTEQDGCDFVGDFAGPMPAIVIAELLGVPPEDRDQFRAWSTALVQSSPLRGERGAGMRAAASLYDYFRSFLSERRTHPRDDLISDLVHSQVDGVALSQDEVLGFCLLLLVAGHETTTNLLANAAVVLAQHPDTRHELADSPENLPLAVEELLRFDSPVQGLARTVKKPITVHGQSLQPGETVLLLFGSANRDETVFTDPDRFDVLRAPERHLALGRGAHFCLGAPLARLEARLALEAMLRRHRDWDVDLETSVRLRSGPVRGYLSMPIQW